MSISAPVGRGYGVKVCLPYKEAKTVKELAQSKGIHDTNLIRQWVLERVHTL